MSKGRYRHEKGSDQPNTETMMVWESGADNGQHPIHPSLPLTFSVGIYPPGSTGGGGGGS
jgi:hypothetical protein